MKEVIILASASPQRSRLLAGLGVNFEIIHSQIHEPSHPEWKPLERAQTLAREKAREVESRYPGRWIIGCDTLVVAPDGTLLEKPVDATEARSMLKLQSGGTSIVHSGLALIAPDGEVFEGMSSSNVTFTMLSSADIEWWIATDLWRDRSGAFQIDGPGQLMIQEIQGDWSSIVGLPIFLLGELAKKAGLSLV